MGLPPRRIAVLTLQRLGDVLTAARVTDALAQRRDTESLEVIHWDATTQAAALLPGARARHALPFNALRHLGRVHPLAALRGLSRHVDEIRHGRGFDTVVNLCSTRFSCWLGPALLAEGGDLRGPSMAANGHYVAGHGAMAYLNDWGSDPDINSFAHQDLYALAARVRLGGFAGLGQASHRRSGPIVVHVRGSESAKDWRTPADWRALVAGLQAQHGVRCVLTGARSEAKTLAEIAGTSGAEVACLPLAECLELLGTATGLVSVDTVAIHLAAAAGCPSVVLRQGPARGTAFVAGPQALCVDAVTAHATVEEVLMLCARQFSHAGGAGRLRAVSPEIRVREGFRDGRGFLALRSPADLPVDEAHHEQDDSEFRWREAWRVVFEGSSPTDGAIDELLASPCHPKRRQALLASPTELGARARARAGRLPHRSAA